MLLNYIFFALFMAIVFLLFYFPFKGNKKWQNGIILLSSYFFYGYLNLTMIPILLLLTIIFFLFGKAIYKGINQHNKSRVLTTLGITIGLGVLFYYKYFSFFIESMNTAYQYFNISPLSYKEIGIIAPIGISYFTLKLISYLIEIRRERIEPLNNFVEFANYISFFPTIMAGPIDRPNSFLPQLNKYHHFNYGMVMDGFKQFLWGAFQKIVISDNLNPYTNNVWEHINSSNGSTLFVALFLYTFQLYTDFSGYSDMAIGVGKIFGYDVTRNFNYPFFAKNMAEFWRRWHISLTSWLTEYVFLPLNVAFRNWGKFGIILAVLINMFLVGLWHGANWTFAVFGIYHGILFIPLILSGSLLKKQKIITGALGLPVFNDMVKMSFTFLLFALSLVLFKSESLAQALEYYKTMISPSLFYPFSLSLLPYPILSILLVFFWLEWYCRKDEYAIQNLVNKWPIYGRWLFYYAIIMAILLFTGDDQQFIYMQF